MPFTFPSHIAAVLPLLHRGSPLHPTSLVVGAMIPDLAYIFGLSGSQTHSPGGVAVCLPLRVLGGRGKKGKDLDVFRDNACTSDQGIGVDAVPSPTASGPAPGQL